jgi:ATP-binding cassette, subfamily B, multidrug efflux pump
LRKKIGYVPQKAFLFKGTISDNIQFGDVNASSGRIEEAIRIAQSYDFVTQKEGGFEAPIAQGGSNVSGGQKQRLAIARAIVRKPEIYIFDDSFSALDFKTDSALRSALMKEAVDATVMLVAQRVSTIMHADRILVIENGKCVGIGKHDELLKSCEVYKEIVYSQLSKEEA